MENNNDIVKALAEVPTLVEMTKQLIEDNEQKFKILAEVAKQKPTAEIPDTELQRVSKAAAEAVANTRCALPSCEMVAKEIADTAICQMSDSIEEKASMAVKTGIKSTPIRHIFTYARTPDLLDVADQKLSKLVKVLLGIVGAMALLIAIVGILYTNSEIRWGRKYQRIIQSEVITDSERAKFLENTYPVGRLPKDYKKSPTRIRKQIRQYEDILEQRQKDIKK